MPIPAYRAKQSTDTAGTGTIVLNLAATNARSFAAAYGASARRVMYCISWASGFEIGLGDFDGGTPGSLTRAAVLVSSNAGALVALPAGTKDVFAVFDPGAREVVAIAGTSTLTLADLGNVINFSGTSAATLNLPAVTSVPIGAGLMVWNTGTAALTIDPNGADTVNGAATLVLQSGAFAEVRRLTTGWMASVPALPSTGGAISGPLLAAAGTAAAPAYSFTGDPDTGVYSSAPNFLDLAVGGQRIAAFTPNSIYLFGDTAQSESSLLQYNAGASALNARAINYIVLNENGYGLTSFRSLVNTDGSGNIEIYATPPGSRTSDRRVIRMIIPGSGPVTVDGRALQIQRGTEQATTSGTAIDFTGIPAEVRRITVMFDGVSFNGSDSASIQLGDSGGIETTGYAGNVGIVAGASAGLTTSLSSAAGIIYPGTAAADNCSGVIQIVNQSGNKWLIAGQVTRAGTAQIHQTVATKTLSNVLDRIRFKVDGASSFDAGAINIMWEF